MTAAAHLWSAAFRDAEVTDPAQLAGRILAIQLEPAGTHEEARVRSVRTSLELPRCGARLWHDGHGISRASFPCALPPRPAQVRTTCACSRHAQRRRRDGSPRIFVYGLDERVGEGIDVVPGVRGVHQS